METKYQMETKQLPEENKPKLDVKTEYEQPLLLKHKPLRDVSGGPKASGEDGFVAIAP